MWIADVCEMRESPDLAFGLVFRCFNASEMAYLRQQATFENAVFAINTFDDFEAVAELGDKLLSARDDIQWKFQWSNPIISSMLQT